jgi:hypothetical protein
MNGMRWNRWAALVALALGLASCASAEQAAGDKVTLKTAKLDDLFKTLESLKGKVVVVDFWADT